MASQRRAARLIAYVVLSLAAIQSLYPLVWMLFGSLKSTEEFTRNLWLPPGVPRVGNYLEAWETAGLSSTMPNSIVVTSTALALIIVMGAPAAYSIARIRPRRAKLILGFLLATMMVPMEAIGIPLFVFMRTLGLTNSRLGLILVYTASGMAFAIFLMYGFFQAIPDELEEAALIDGARPLQILSKIVVPLAMPGVLTVVIFQGMTIWNEFFIAYLLVRDRGKMTMPQGLVYFFGRYSVDWPALFAALVIVSLPVLIAFVIAQRRFIEGIVSGATKG